MTDSVTWRFAKHCLVFICLSLEDSLEITFFFKIRQLGYAAGKIYVFVPLEFKGRAWADSEMPALSISAVQVLQGQWAPVEVALKALTSSPQLIGL